MGLEYRLGDKKGLSIHKKNIGARLDPQKKARLELENGLDLGHKKYKTFHTTGET